MAHFDASLLAVFHEKILPPCLFVGPESAVLEHEGRKRGCACSPSVARIFSGFTNTTACSIANCCRRISPRLFILHSPSWRRRNRFIRRRRGYGGLVCLWAFSFHLQFHDLRLVLESVTAALAGRARCALRAERKREPSDFGGGETSCRRDLLVGKIHGL